MKRGCERCQGNGEIVTDWDRYLHSRPGDVGDEAVDECPDCNGQGEVEVPLRIQLRRTKGWRMPAGTVKCGRSTKWGNPWKAGMRSPYGSTIPDQRQAANTYMGMAPQNEQLVAAARAELAGADLGCWCRLCDLHQDGKPLLEDCPYCDRCHVDTLGKIANGVLP